MSFAHRSVLLNEAVAMLNIIEDGVYVDCTLGGGGHSAKILELLSNCGHLYSFDQDELAISNARNKFSSKSNITLIHDNFKNIKHRLVEQGVTSVDGFLYDLGVSSPQLDIGERGFSYQQDAVLDMRMDINNKVTAYQVINQLDEAELNNIFWEYGEERWAKRVAQFIAIHRKIKPIETTGELVTIIKKAIPKGARKDGPHPAKRIFQALRIYVNDEMNSLRHSLDQAVDLLNSKGRISVITFHSLEDRIVKQFIKENSQGCICPPGMPICTCGKTPVVKNITRKPLEPSKDEIEANPRARSAKLRGCEKI